MLQDLRLALRNLLRSRGFTTVAVVTLAVGIGSVTAMFSVLRALVVEPFSYPDAGRLVHVWSNNGQPLSTPDYFDIADRTVSFAELGVYSPQAANLGGESPQAVRSVACTAGVLRAFGVAPAHGRLFAPADCENGAPPAAILSHELWAQSFGADPGLVGRTIRLNGGDFTVVGIMPAGYEFAAPWMRSFACQLWTPLQLKRGEGDRGSHWMCAVGRLKPGVSPGAADAEIKAIGAQLKAAHPDTNMQKPFLVRSLHEEMTRDVRKHVWMLFGAVGLVLLVACANVASMVLARNARRQGEFGVRIALGASRTHILRLSFVESLVLAFAGAVAGVALAFVFLRVFQVIAPVSDARKAAMVLDAWVLAFGLGLTLLSSVLAGIPPALAAMRISVSGLLRSDARGCAGSRARHHLLRALIIAQVAVAFVLANGAALFSASYLRLLAANEKLATEQVLSAAISLRGDRYSKKEDRVRFWESLAGRAAAIPGVAVAGVTTKLPLEGGSNLNILVNDEVFDPKARRMLAEVSSITPGYFDAAGIALLKGRTLEPGDAGEDSIGVVVNRTLADKCWPDGQALGQIIRPSASKAWFHARVVGVVESVRQWGPEEDPRPEIYWPPDRAWGQSFFLLVRSTRPAAQLAPALRRELAALDPDLPLSRIRTLQAVVDEATQGQRVVAGLVDGFMALALGLVGVGLYGTLSYHVLQRTREIGVRVAVGASRRDILGLVFGQGGRWVLAGLVIGAAGALGLATTLRSLLYGIDTFNPLTLLGGGCVVAAAGAFACWLPARRATKVNPIEALRGD